MAFAESEALGAAALQGALDPSLPIGERSRAALKIIDVVDPQQTMSVEAELPTDPEGVERLGLRELLGYAQHLGLEVPSS